MLQTISMYLIRKYVYCVCVCMVRVYVGTGEKWTLKMQIKLALLDFIPSAVQRASGKTPENTLLVFRGVHFLND